MGNYKVKVLKIIRVEKKDEKFKSINKSMD